MYRIKQIQGAKIGYIIMSVLLCALGITFISFPSITLITLCKITGVVMCVYGAVKILGYFSRDLYRLAFQFDLAYGLLIMLVGAMMIIFTGTVYKSFGFFIGLIALTDALFKIQITVDSKKFGISKWWLIGIFAVITAVIGIGLILNPYIAAEYTMILIGTVLVFEGIMNLCVAIFMVKIIRYSENISTNYEIKGER